MQRTLYYHLGLLNALIISGSVLKKIFLYSFVGSTILAGIIILPSVSSKKKFVMPQQNAAVVDSFSKVMTKVSYQINIINDNFPDKE